MILAALPTLNSLHIVLASGSPRRRELLEQIGLKFRVMPSTFSENLDKSAFAEASAYPVETAYRKTMEVAGRCGNEADVVIGADTVVVRDDGDGAFTILEKPRDDGHAREILQSLSGQSHSVITGVIVHDVRRNKTTRLHVSTRVRFASLSAAEIDAYVATGEYKDKAGGYGIQGIASVFVESLEGCYYNVVGLPLHSLCSTLAALI